MPQPPPPAPLPILAPRLPGNSPSPVDKPSTKEHTEEEWLGKKEIIRRLYIDEHKKLSEVMSILESRYEFAATEQMYKKRLNKWAIRKRPYRRAPRETSNASSSAAPSESLDAAEADVGELPTSQPQQELAITSSRTTAEASGYRLVTPLPRLPPLEALEVVLDSVSSWSEAKLEPGFVATDPMARYLAQPDEPPVQDSRTMYRIFELGFDLWYLREGDLAGIAVRRGCYAIDYVLTDDHPDMIWHVFDTIYDMIERGHLDLLMIFLQHALVIAPANLPKSHPLLRILEQLRECDFQTDQGRQHVCHLLRQAWLRNVDLVVKHVGLAHPQHLWPYEQLIWDGRTRLRRNSKLETRRAEVMGALQGLEQRCQRGWQEPDYEKLRAQALMLEFVQMDVKDAGQAEALATGLIQRTQSWAVKTRSGDRFEAYAWKMLARLCEEKHEFAQAEQHLRRAIAKREAAHGGFSNLRVIRDMWVLAGLLQRAGRLDDANAVIRDATARAQDYLNNSNSNLETGEHG